MFLEKVLGRMAVIQHDPLLSESQAPFSSGSEGEEYLVNAHAMSWVDHMKYVDGLAKGKPEPWESNSGQLLRKQLCLAMLRKQLC